MSGIGEHGDLALSRPSPKQIHNRPLLCVHSLYNRIGEFLPASSLMGISLMRPNREHRIQHQNSLVGPLFEIAVVGDIAPQILL